MSWEADSHLDSRNDKIYAIGKAWSLISKALFGKRDAKMPVIGDNILRNKLLADPTIKKVERSDNCFSL